MANSEAPTPFETSVTSSPAESVSHEQRDIHRAKKPAKLPELESEGEEGAPSVVPYFFPSYNFAKEPLAYYIHEFVDKDAHISDESLSQEDGKMGFRIQICQTLSPLISKDTLRDILDDCRDWQKEQSENQKGINLEYAKSETWRSRAIDTEADKREKTKSRRRRLRKDSGQTFAQRSSKVSSPSEYFRSDAKSNKITYFSLVPRAGKLESSPDRLQHVKDLEADIEHWKSQYQKTQEEVKATRKALQESHAKLILKEQQVAALQQEHFNHVTLTAVSLAEDDDYVRQSLRDMTEDWSKWAKDYALRELRVGSVVDAIVRNHVCRDSKLDKPSSGSEWSKHGLRPRMILLAQLAGHIALHVIQKPFTSFHHNPSQDRTPISVQLDHAYNSMLPDDPRQAHLWRSRTLQMMDLPLANGGRKDTVTASFQRRSEVYDREARLFVERNSAILQQVPANERFTCIRRLRDILENVGELFAKLWRQKTYITVQGRDALAEESFDPDSTLYQLHTAHPKLDDQDGLSGQTIDFVVLPAILAWGNEDGDDYHERKVWFEARVWLSTVAV